MDVNFESKIGRAVYERRKLLDLRQRDLALLAGCSELFVIELEKGKPTVRLDKVIDVFRALGLQISIETGNQGVVDRSHAR